MKISILTIVLILFTLISGLGWLISSSSYKSMNKLCEELRPTNNPILEDGRINQANLDAWQQCISVRNVSSSIMITRMASTIIFAILIELSWEIDKLKRK